MIEVLIDILVGFGAGLLGLLTRRYAHESFFLASNVHRIVSVTLFIAGLACLNFLLASEPAWKDLSVPTLLTALAVSVLYRLRYHLILKEADEAASRSSRFWFLRPVEMRSGYFESKEYDEEDNAWNTRFGHTTIGRRSDRGIWSRVLGRDGWSRSQRKALIRHENGHTINAFPAFLLEAFLFCWAFTSFSWSPASLLVLPALFTAITLMAWLDELAADSIAGFCGFSLERLLSKDRKLDHYFLGTVGAASHPPHVLRWLAFLTRIFVVILWGLAGWAVYWTFITK